MGPRTDRPRWTTSSDHWAGAVHRRAFHRLAAAARGLRAAGRNPARLLQRRIIDLPHPDALAHGEPQPDGLLQPVVDSHGVPDPVAELDANLVAVRHPQPYSRAHAQPDRCPGFGHEL